MDCSGAVLLNKYQSCSVIVVARGRQVAKLNTFRQNGYISIDMRQVFSPWWKSCSQPKEMSEVVIVP
jgi:hypothetical protein